MKDFKVVFSNKKVAIFSILSFLLLVGMLYTFFFNCQSFVKKIRLGNLNELRLTKTYDLVKEDEEITQNDNVKFDAYVLKDLDGDGKAEKLRGTCKHIGEQDTLYMELNVMGQGTLKNSKITINGENMCLATGLAEDDIISKNYISGDVSTIELKNITQASNSTIIGYVKSGNYSYSSLKSSAIKYGNINNYSALNKICFSAIQVNDDGTEQAIYKEVPLQVDWYGNAETQIENLTQSKKIDEINKELQFDMQISEIKEELMVSGLHVEGKIPVINGCTPTNVTLPNGGVWNKEKNTFYIDMNSQIDGNGIIIKELGNTNRITVNLEYPDEAFTDLSNVNSITMPVTAYYSAYNNENIVDLETTSKPVTKNITLLTYTSVIDAEYYLNTNCSKKDISKKNILETSVNSENVIDDDYEVTWELIRAKEATISPLVLEQTHNDNMDGINVDSIENTGIYFSGNITELIGENGYIRLYNEDTNELIKEFNHSNWNLKYNYTQDVKRIKIETSNTISDKSSTGNIVVHNIKKINNLKLSNEFSLDEILSFDNIYTDVTAIATNKLTQTRYINYNNYTSDVNISCSTNDFSTQVETNTYLTIKAENDVWQNGKFLVKLPEQITKVSLNNIHTSNSNVNIVKKNICKENNNIYLELDTENKNKESFEIYINADFDFDTMAMNSNLDIEVFAVNPNFEVYSLASRVDDVYNLGSTSSYITHSSTNINIIAPNSLVTTEKIVNDNGEVLAKPLQQIEIDKDELNITRHIQLELLNNYSLGGIKDAYIIGKIPFSGNCYQTSGKDMESNFNSYMTKEGIKVPLELKDKVKIYYSAKDMVTNSLSDVSNEWTQTPNDFSKIKNYYIDLSNIEMSLGDKCKFSYDINLDSNVVYNAASYCNHTTYFTLQTNEGDLQQRIETGKLGILVAKRFSLDLTKYSELDNDKVANSTYVISDNKNQLINTTNSEGKITFDNLYVEKQYEVYEQNANDNYELDTEHKVITTSFENNEFKINVIKGKIRNANATIGNGFLKAKLDLDSKSKYNLNLTKYEKNSSNTIENVKFELSSEDGKSIITTDSNGSIKMYKLLQDKIYTLTEIYAKGCKSINDSIMFKVEKQNNILVLKILNGNVKSDSSVIKLSGELPKLNLNVENEKLSSYLFELTKYEKGKDKVIPKTSFNITGKWMEDTSNQLVTNDNGKIRVNLYEGIEYTLKETLAAPGYSLNEDVVKFFAIKDNNGKWDLTVTQGSFKDIPDIEEDNIKVALENESLFTITKEDSETGELLKGVKFAIYNVEKALDGTEKLSEAKDINGNVVGNEETINGVNYKVLETDENGNISVQLQKGLYKAVEVQALEGYNIENIDKYTYYFGISESLTGTATLTKVWDNENISERNIIKANDGGYAGVISSQITKYNSNFDVQWQTTIENDDKFFKIIQTNDGGFVAIGENNIIKCKYDGTKEWEKSCSPSSGYSCYKDIITTKDGNVLLVMSVDPYKNDIYTFNSSYGVFAAYKLNLNGDILWKNAMDFSSYQSDFGMIKTMQDDDQNYIVVASKYNNTNYQYSDHVGGEVYKFDNDGNKIWGTTLNQGAAGSYYSLAIYGCTLDEDGGYIFSGYTSEYQEYGVYPRINDTDSVKTFGMILKVDKNGKKEWIKVNEDENMFFEIQKLSNGQYIVQSLNSIYLYSRDFEVLGKYTFDDNRSMFDERYYGYVYSYNFNSFNRFNIVNNNQILVAGSNNFSYEGNKTTLINIDGISQNIPDKQQIKIYNSLKEFNITTSVGENGTISGQNDIIYESVKYGKNSQKEIKITPDNGYAVLEILVNGKKILFDENEDGSVNLPNFSNVTQDKNIVANFAPKSKIGSVKVNYLKNNTETKIADTKKITALVGQKYSVSPDVNISGYELVVDKLPSNNKGVISEVESQVNYYYDEQPVKVTTYYLNNNDGTNISTPKVEYKSAGDEYSTSPLMVIDDKYIYNSCSDNVKGIVTGNEEGKEVNVYYYYKPKEFKIITSSLNEGGTISGSDRSVFEIVEYGNSSKQKIVITPDYEHDVETVFLNDKKIEFNKMNDGSVIINNFVNVREDKNVSVKFKQATSKVITRYLECGTDKKVREDNVQEGIVGDNYSTSKIDISGYKTSGNEPSNKVGKYTKNVIYVDYYYENVICGVVVKYLEEGTNKVLLKEEQAIGNVGDNYTTDSKEIDGYKLVKQPDNKNGVIKEGFIEVIYYYSKNNNSAINPITGDILINLLIAINLSFVVFISTFFIIKKRGDIIE